MSRLLPFLCLASICASGPATSLAEADEYTTKARILLMVLPYIQWSSQATWKEGPFQIAVLGESPFGLRLEEAARALTIHHRPIQIRQVSKVRDAEGCQALFICPSETRRLDSILSWVRGRDILTMSDDEALARRGVMLNFLIEDGYVRLAVNPVEAKEAGLQLGSRLLSLARVVSAPRSVS